MVNDRLGDLKAALNENYDSHNIPIDVDEEDPLLSAFFSLVEEISSSLDKIVDAIEEIKKMHSAILCAPFPDERMKQELERLMAEVKRLSSKVKQKLKLMAEDIALEKQNNTSSSSLRMKKMQHSALSQRCITAISDYNIIQIEYRERCKDRIKRQLEIMGNVKTDAEIEELLENENFAVFTQGIVVETQKVRQNLTDIEDRYADIIQLEKSVRELHDMFADIALLVENQGELVDSIEYNARRASECVRLVIPELKKGRIYQRAARKKIIILSILAVLTTIIILAIIIGVTV